MSTDKRHGVNVEVGKKLCSNLKGGRKYDPSRQKPCVGPHTAAANKRTSHAQPQPPIPPLSVLFLLSAVLCSICSMLYVSSCWYWAADPFRFCNTSSQTSFTSTPTLNTSFDRSTRKDKRHKQTGRVVGRLSLLSTYTASAFKRPNPIIIKFYISSDNKSTTTRTAPLINTHMVCIRVRDMMNQGTSHDRTIPEPFNAPGAPPHISLPVRSITTIATRLKA
jgi:hypothetical protein